MALTIVKAEERERDPIAIIFSGMAEIRDWPLRPPGVICSFCIGRTLCQI